MSLILQLLFEPLESPALAESSAVSFLQNHFPSGILSPQISPTLSPDSSMNISSNPLSRRHSQNEKSSFNQNLSNSRYCPITKQQKISSNNNNSMLTNNIQNNSTTNLLTNMIGSPNKLPSNSMSSLLEFTSPLMNNMISTSIAQETMPNLNLGGNLVSDVMIMQPSTSVLQSEIDPITPSSLMKLQKTKPNSLKSGQNEQNSNSQQQSQQEQLQPPSKVQSIFITTPQLNQVRSIMVVKTGTGGVETNHNIVSPHMIISPNVSPVSPGMT